MAIIGAIYITPEKKGYTQAYAEVLLMGKKSSGRDISLDSKKVAELHNEFKQEIYQWVLSIYNEEHFLPDSIDEIDELNTDKKIYRRVKDDIGYRETSVKNLYNLIISRLDEIHFNAYEPIYNLQEGTRYSLLVNDFSKENNKDMNSIYLVYENKKIRFESGEYDIVTEEKIKNTLWKAITGNEYKNWNKI